MNSIRSPMNNIDGTPSDNHSTLNEEQSLDTLSIHHKFHTKSVAETEKILQVDSTKGLSEDEAKERLEKFGLNRLDDKGGIKFHIILFHHLVNFINGVLLTGVILSLVVAEYVDAGVIAGVIIANTLIGFFQEYHSEKTVESLRKLSQPTTTVIREGTKMNIPSPEVTIGDIVVLVEGSRIPADMRIFYSTSLEIDESILTGESVPVEKSTNALDAENIALGDRVNCAFMGCIVSKGKGRGLVTAIANDTEMGEIARMTSTPKKEKTTLQKRLDKLGLFLVIFAIFCIGLVLLGAWIHKVFPIYPNGLQVGISVAVAIIPEGLVAVVTLTLTYGVRRLVKKKAIVRKLAALETLGNVTNICTDKTGTLTEGKMVATHLWIPTSKRKKKGRTLTVSGVALEPVGNLLEKDQVLDSKEIGVVAKIAVLTGSLCNTSSISQKPVEENEYSEDEEEEMEWVGVGDPTEVALVVLGHKLKLDRPTLGDKWKFTLEFPFDSTLKRKSLIFIHNTKKAQEEEFCIFTKGATERVLALCTEIAEDDDSKSEIFHRTITKADATLIQAKASELAAIGLRVLTLAYQILPPKRCKVFAEETKNISKLRDEFEDKLCFVGLVGIKDPPRQSVPNSIQVCHQAGIVVHMVTGDHPSTALAIARQIGLFPSNVPTENQKDLVTTALEFDALTEDELNALDPLPLVIARCSPESKVRMVQTLHRRNKIVAMLGDGVNDAPAIKMSDVGVAMGKNGSDVTKEVADIILTDDNFSTIIGAISEGRRIFANIRKFLVNYLASNVTEALVLLIGILIGLPPPLSPLQLLWVNLVTGTGPALALGISPGKNLMKKKGRKTMFTKEAIIDILFYGVVMAMLNLANFLISLLVFQNPIPQAQSVSFGTLTFLLIFNAYNCRVVRKSFLSEGFLKSYFLHGAIVFAIGTVFFAYYVDVIETEVFHHQRPNWETWLLILGALVIFIVVCEIYKVVKRCVVATRKKRKRRQRETRTAIPLEVVKEV